MIARVYKFLLIFIILIGIIHFFIVFNLKRVQKFIYQSTLSREDIYYRYDNILYEFVVFCKRYLENNCVKEVLFVHHPSMYKEYESPLYTFLYDDYKIRYHLYPVEVYTTSSLREEDYLNYRYLLLFLSPSLNFKRYKVCTVLDKYRKIMKRRY
ncbi:MAG: hypothetical protein B6D55_06005 [Candidatus Omnitrophica bacterium 4484_70.2]|nr:MAG: hypothetical protein B6D55_06005 [Candidatus Omnitrophica bacterium 4484_70.2]